MTTKTATVYRMVMPDHVCPYGLKTVDLLKREGFEVDDLRQQRGVNTSERAPACVGARSMITTGPARAARFIMRYDSGS